MTPSQSIVSGASRTLSTVDSRGRRFTLRRLTALDTLRLFKAAGPLLSQNEAWLSMAGVAFAVLEIDDVPVPTPTTEAQIEGLIDRLGDDGLTAIADTMRVEPSIAATQADVGNLPGTPS